MNQDTVKEILESLTECEHGRLMTKRQKVRGMFGGKCAYCGKELGKIFHVDHVAPIFRGWTGVLPEKAGEDDDQNEFPACPRCNIRKSTLSVEQFRSEIMLQVMRLRRDSSAFKLAEDFGIIKTTEKPVVFWFEKLYSDYIEYENPRNVKESKEALRDS